MSEGTVRAEHYFRRLCVGGMQVEKGGDNDVRVLV
jgi:hypothetical protein